MTKLKIKDDINLGELENYGFNILNDIRMGEHVRYYTYNDLDSSIKIDINDRTIDIYIDESYNEECSYVESKVLNKLYDLIMAGLVEKQLTILGILELLGMIARNEEIPKKIKYKDVIYEYDEYLKEYYHGHVDYKEYLSDDFNIGLILNDEVEVIEE